MEWWQEKVGDVDGPKIKKAFICPFFQNKCVLKHVVEWKHLILSPLKMSEVRHIFIVFICLET